MFLFVCVHLHDLAMIGMSVEHFLRWWGIGIIHPCSSNSANKIWFLQIDGAADICVVLCVVVAWRN